MAEEKKTGGKKHITGARIAKEIRQYKKDALLSPMYTTLCVVLEILIPYLTASIIDKGIAVGDHGARREDRFADGRDGGAGDVLRHACRHTQRTRQHGSGRQSARVDVRTHSGLFLFQYRQVLHRGPCHAP